MSKQSNILRNTLRLARYNMKIIFGGRFVYFILAAFIFFLLFGTIMALNDNTINVEDLYGLLAFPGILMVFYPTVFGIQNDADQRTLEIIFGIPDYRYKVWLVRLLMVLILVSFLMIPLALLAQFALVSIPIVKMIAHIMVLVLFASTLGFALSTMVKNGNAAAVIMVVISLVFLILIDPLEDSKWNILLNPFRNPGRINEIVWMEIIRQNRIFMVITSVVLLLIGLLNLQNREKFLR